MGTDGREERNGKGRGKRERKEREGKERGGRVRLGYFVQWPPSS